MIVYRTTDNRRYYFTNQKALAHFLDYQYNRLPILPAVVQMEIYFEGFNWWWYDDVGRLHPNDSDYPSEPLLDYEPYDDDIPF